MIIQTMVAIIGFSLFCNLFQVCHDVIIFVSSVKYIADILDIRKHIKHTVLLIRNTVIILFS